MGAKVVRLPVNDAGRPGLDGTRSELWLSTYLLDRVAADARKRRGYRPCLDAGQPSRSQQPRTYTRMVSRAAFLYTISAVFEFASMQGVSAIGRKPGSVVRDV
jgi:hypothetical protein